LRIRARAARVDPAASLAGASPSDVAEGLQLLRQIAEDIHVLAARAPRVIPPIAPYDPAAAELLRAIAATSQGQKFSVAELLSAVEVVADRVEDKRLRDAIVGALGGEFNGKRLGQLLRRVAKAPISDSFCVVRVGKKKRDGVTWRVATFEAAKVAKVVAPPASDVKNYTNGT
jgi:hypothetical protein